MKKRYILCCLLMVFGLSAFKEAPAFKTSPRISAAGSGKLLTDWITLHLKLVRNTKGLSQGALFRHFTLASVGFYESLVNGDKRYVSLGGQLQELPALPVFAAEKNTCWQASANASMAASLRAFYAANPANIQKIDSLENAFNLQFSKEGFTEAGIKAASAYGVSVTEAVLQWAKGDGSAVQRAPYEIPKGDGMWEPTPPGFTAPAAPFAYLNRTCVKNSTENTLPPAPAKFSSEAGSPFYTMVNEVLTASQNLTDAQKAMALFWDDFPDGRYYGAAGHWASIFRQVVDAKQFSLIEAAEAYVKMNAAMMDGFYACWKGKYTYNVLRPVTYIHKYMDRADWKPLIVTPAHPEYPAAHASISMAAATALTSAWGNNIAFTDHTYDDLGFAPRPFKNFEEAGKEAGLSRLYGGIHYRPSIDAGYVLGKKTATNVVAGLRFRKK